MKLEKDRLTAKVTTMTLEVNQDQSNKSVGNEDMTSR